MADFIHSTKYCDPHSVLVVGNSGKIARLMCPFKVLCVHTIGDIPLNSYPTVEEVKMTELDQLVYILNGKAFYHSYFRILLEL